MLVFEERGKLEYPEKNLSEQRTEPTTNSTHNMTPGRNRTRNTLVGGERSHHFAIPASLKRVLRDLSNSMLNSNTNEACRTICSDFNCALLSFWKITQAMVNRAIIALKQFYCSSSCRKIWIKGLPEYMKNKASMWNTTVLPYSVRSRSFCIIYVMS